jgi:hypothetical protein
MVGIVCRRNRVAMFSWAKPRLNSVNNDSAIIREWLGNLRYSAVKTRASPSPRLGLPVLHEFPIWRWGHCHCKQSLFLLDTISWTRWQYRNMRPTYGTRRVVPAGSDHAKSMCLHSYQPGRTTPSLCVYMILCPRNRVFLGLRTLFSIPKLPL